MRSVIETAAFTVALVSLAGIASAQTTTDQMHGGWGGHNAPPGVFGVVSAISGDTITVSSKGFGKNATATTYTIDATNATVTKNGSSSSVSAIAVGDRIMAQGTISGTSVTATKINDGMMGGPGAGRGMGPGSKGPSFSGNGEPVVGGTITAVNGNTISITNKSNVTYTIDATNATVDKGNATSSVSSLAVGDSVVVQGTVNGSSVTASSIIDSGTPPSTTNSKPAPQKGFFGGFFGGIGNFFRGLFGF